MFDAEQRIQVLSSRFLDIVRTTTDEFPPGTPLRKLHELGVLRGVIDPENAEEVYQKWLAAFAKGKTWQFDRALPDGQIVEYRVWPIENGAGICTIEDVTTRRQRDADYLTAVEELKISHQQFNNALDSMTDGLSMVDKDFRVLVINQRFEDLFGVQLEAVRGEDVRDVITRIVESGVFGSIKPRPFMRKIFKNAEKGLVSTFTLASGRTIRITHQRAAGGGWTAIYQDVTESTLAHKRVAHMATHDALTDLPNRKLFLNRLNAGLQRARRRQGALAILCLDLDDFKSVNDTLGHPTGDKLLQELAKRLRRVAGKRATVARLGGDEFAIIQTGHQPDDAIRLAERIAAAMAKPLDCDGQLLNACTSIGIAVAPTDAENANDLMKCADLALYRAKAEGRGCYALFEPAMNRKILERRTIENDLRRALGNQEFVLHYQPQVRLQDDQLIGAEALLRWNHPERGLIMPADFIPLAEETGLIVPIGEWVLREACRTAASWPPNVKIAVNISPAQFALRHGLMALVPKILEETGLMPFRLEFEITEALLLRDLDRAFAALHELRALGIRISLDDFGTGYSSLSYLRAFPFDRIKIDRSFIAGLGARDDSNAIVKSVVDLGRNLNIPTIGEGIETIDQYKLLRAFGCQAGQGNFISHPQPAESVFGEFTLRKDERRVA